MTSVQVLIQVLCEWNLIVTLDDALIIVFDLLYQFYVVFLLCSIDKCLISFSFVLLSSYLLL